MMSRSVTRTVLVIVGLVLLLFIAVWLALAMISPNYLMVDLRLPVAIVALLVAGLLAWRYRFKNR